MGIIITIVLLIFVGVNIFLYNHFTTVILNINHKIKIIMATQAEFNEQLDRLNAASTAIAAKLRTLEDQISNAGLSAQVEASVLEQLRSAADALEAMGSTEEAPTEETV